MSSKITRDRKHKFVSKRLSAYMDDELAAGERARVEAHLSTCEQCRADLHTLRWTQRVLRETPAVRVPRAFVVREADVTRRPVGRRLSLFAAQWATAAVALLFVLALGGDLLIGRQLHMAAPAAPQAEMAWSAAETLSITQEVEADVTQVARKVAVTEVVEEKAVELQAAKPEAERPVEPEGKDVRAVPLASPPSPAEAAKESQIDEEQGGGVGATGITTPTAAPQAMKAVPEDTSPASQAEGEQQVLGGDTPTVAPPAAVQELPEYAIPAPAARPLLSLRGWWRVAEVVLGVTLVGLLVAVVWMRRRG